ncbi:hypothetical protein [Variibacter gotjawalensis]|jgi:hypothetical protein|uniref:hypothetical protein n=1 Tax=Variibacter gotjawalensis TaxID=1333996 RepID=UPI0012FE05B7|nr:hypothetical protein [Variibacter gotjawalensis]NIK49211.1 hypothetical protein [Variibacter gotjawalensis]
MTHHHHHHDHHHAPQIQALPSLLRLSAVQRLAAAGSLSVLIWLAIFWAMQ